MLGGRHGQRGEEQRHIADRPPLTSGSINDGPALQRLRQVDGEGPRIAFVGAAVPGRQRRTCERAHRYHQRFVGRLGDRLIRM
jgi:hypothetical protein